MAIVSNNISHKYLYQDDIKRYDFTFKLLDNNSLDVYRVRDNVEVKLVNDIDYSIEYNELIGGYITLTDTGCSKFSNGDVLGILASPNSLQELKTDEHNVLYKKDIENSLDKLTQLYHILSAKISKLPLPPLYLDDSDVSYSDITEIYNESKDYKEVIAEIKTEIDKQLDIISGIVLDLNNKFATDEEVLAGIVSDKIISPKGVGDVIASTFATDAEIDVATVLNKIVAPKQVKDMIAMFGDIKCYPEDSLDMNDVNVCNHTFLTSYSPAYLGMIGSGVLLNLCNKVHSAQLVFISTDDGVMYRISLPNGDFLINSWREFRCTSVWM